MRNVVQLCLVLSVWLQMIFCPCINETTLLSFLRSFLGETRQIASLPEDIH